MKPIKCWIAQDRNTHSVYAYFSKPWLGIYQRWYTQKDTGYLGQRLLADNRHPVKCVIITEEEYGRLKELDK